MNLLIRFESISHRCVIFSIYYTWLFFEYLTFKYFIDFHVHQIHIFQIIWAKNLSINRIKLKRRYVIFTLYQVVVSYQAMPIRSLLAASADSDDQTSRNCLCPFSNIEKKCMLIWAHYNIAHHYENPLGYFGFKLITH